MSSLKEYEDLMKNMMSKGLSQVLPDGAGISLPIPSMLESKITDVFFLFFCDGLSFISCACPYAIAHLSQDNGELVMHREFEDVNPLCKPDFHPFEWSISDEDYIGYAESFTDIRKFAFSSSLDDIQKKQLSNYCAAVKNVSDNAFKDAYDYISQEFNRWASQWMSK